VDASGEGDLQSLWSSVASSVPSRAGESVLSGAGGGSVRGVDTSEDKAAPTNPFDIPSEVLEEEAPAESGQQVYEPSIRNTDLPPPLAPTSLPQVSLTLKPYTLHPKP